MAHPGAQGFEAVRSRWEEKRKKRQRDVPGVALVLLVECSGPGVTGFIWQKLQEPGPAWQCLAWIMSGLSEKPRRSCQFQGPCPGLGACPGRGCLEGSRAATPEDRTRTGSACARGRCRDGFSQGHRMPDRPRVMLGFGFTGGTCCCWLF